MLSESAWRPRCGAVLRALGEQADSSKTIGSPNLKDSSGIAGSAFGFSVDVGLWV